MTLLSHLGMSCFSRGFYLSVFPFHMVCVALINHPYVAAMFAYRGTDQVCHIRLKVFNTHLLHSPIHYCMHHLFTQ